MTLQWTAAERVRLSGIVATVVALNVAGWSLYLYYTHNLTAAGTFAGAGTLAYVLGVRHAFDADHIAAIDRELANRGLMNRMLGGRIRGLIRSSWHMFAVGLLFGLGLETASEVTLLSLQASTAAQGALPALAVLTLPLLFAAGMSTLDTADSLLMTRAYSWAYRQPARRLYYNLATTGMTVVVALFVASVYLADLAVQLTGVGGPIAAYAQLADRFEVLGYAIVGAFLLAWVGAVLMWRLGRFEERYRA